MMDAAFLGSLTNLWTPTDASETIFWMDTADASRFTLGAGNAIQRIDNKITTPPAKASIFMQQPNGAFQPVLSNNEILSDRKFLYDLNSWTRTIDGSVQYGWVLAVDVQVGATDVYGRILTYEWQTDAGATPGRDGSTIEALYSGATGGVSPQYTYGKFWFGAGSYVFDPQVANEYVVLSTRRQDRTGVLFETGNIGTAGTAALPIVDWSQGFSLGGHLTAVNASTLGKFRDLVFYDATTDSSGALHDRLVGWLAWKVGSQGRLPAGHPFKNAPPTK